MRIKNFLVIEHLNMSSFPRVIQLLLGVYDAVITDSELSFWFKKSVFVVAWRDNEIEPL